MAQQEDGWPLGLLQPMNARVIGLARNHDRNGSISFSTLITGSPPTSSTDSTSDLDSQSTGSFFRDRSITLGSLMGVSSILELSRRSMRGRPSENLRGKKNSKSKPWLFSLCSKLNTDAVSMSNGTPSLGHFLESERRAATTCRRNPGPLAYGPDGFSQDPNSLFVSSHIASAQSSAWFDSNGERRSSKDLFENGNGFFLHLKVEHDVRDQLLSILYPSIPLQTLTYASILNSTMIRTVDLEEPVKGISHTRSS